VHGIAVQRISQMRYLVDHPAHSCCKSTSCALHVAYVSLLSLALMDPSTQHRTPRTLSIAQSTLRLVLRGTAFLIVKLICRSTRFVTVWI